MKKPTEKLGRRQWFGLCWICWLTAIGNGLALATQNWRYMGFYTAVWVAHIVLDVIENRRTG